jgi:hypothetical protein
LLRRLTEEMGLTRGQKGRARNAPANDLADFGSERAQAEKPTTSHLGRAGRSGVTSVIVDARAPGSAMVDHIGMGKAGGRVLAVAERKRRRRHDEAKRRERCKNDREPKAEPDGERSQHGFRMVFIPAFRRVLVRNRFHK